MEKFRYVLNMMIAALLLLTVAISHNGKVMGVAVDELFRGETGTQAAKERLLDDGTLVVNSTTIAKEILGYGGTTPVEIYLKDNRIVKIEVLENNETYDFLDAVLSSGVLDRWNGLTLDEALAMNVDAISGATLTSDALYATVKKTVGYAASIETKATTKAWSAKSLIGLLVIFTGVLFSFVAKSGKWRTLQLLLNVIVLGFWCGSFLSLSLLTNWLSNGVNIVVAIVPFTLLLLTLILPFVGKKGHYCAWHCPLGSLQELADKCNRGKKIAIPSKLNKYLNTLREGIFLALLIFMWVGVGFSLMDYELFSAFLYNSAHTMVIVAALLFIVLSLFIKRPYCRFVCPTGTLLKLFTIKRKK